MVDTLLKSFRGKSNNNKSPVKADNSSNILRWLLLRLYFVVGGSYWCVSDGLWLGTQTFHALLDSLKAQGTIHILCKHID